MTGTDRWLTTAPARAPLDAGTENAALGEALAAEHAAVWGYGVVGAALRPPTRAARRPAPRPPTATSATR